MNLIAKLRATRLKTKSKLLICGIAAVEFALTLPIWITVLLGTADGTYYLLINEKVDRIAYSITDIVTQYKVVTVSNLDDIARAASELMQPITFGSNGVIIVSSIYRPSGDVPRICWQYTGGGTMNGTSQVGTANGAASCSNGSAATLPAGLTLNNNDNIIMTEVYFNFSPMFLFTELFPAKQLYRYAIYKPRLSPLVTPPT